MIDKQTGLYIVKNGNKYGVLDNSGNIVIHSEYEKIGIDTSNFPNDSINNKWGLFNTSGKLIVPIEFDEIGCKQSNTNANMKNILLVPTYKAIVMGKVKDNNVRNYGIYDNQGRTLIPCALTKVSRKYFRY